MLCYVETLILWILPLTKRKTIAPSTQSERLHCVTEASGAESSSDIMSWLWLSVIFVQSLTRNCINSSCRKSKLNYFDEKRIYCFFTSEQDMFKLKGVIMANWKSCILDIAALSANRSSWVSWSHLWHNGLAVLICMIMVFVILSLILDTHYDNNVGVCKFLCVKQVMTYWLTDWSQADYIWH